MAAGRQYMNRLAEWKSRRTKKPPAIAVDMSKKPEDRITEFRSRQHKATVSLEAGLTPEMRIDINRPGESPAQYRERKAAEVQSGR